LAGGPSESEGRVEVYFNGVWGTVCDNGWDDQDATVVCRSLGYSNGRALGNAYYGEGADPIWMENVGCLGSEVSLDTCSFPGFGQQNCRHSDDAGVQCFQDSGIIDFVLL